MSESLQPTPGPRAAVGARIAALLAAPPPPHLTLEQRLSVPRAVRRLMPDRTPLADALEAALLRAEVTA